jgi:hypothetical protein
MGNPARNTHRTNRSHDPRLKNVEHGFYTKIGVVGDPDFPVVKIGFFGAWGMSWADPRKQQSHGEFQRKSMFSYRSFASRLPMSGMR